MTNLDYDKGESKCIAPFNSYDATLQGISFLYTDELHSSTGPVRVKSEMDLVQNMLEVL